MLKPVPLYLIVSASLGFVYAIYEMWWIRRDAKRNPEKYVKEEEPRVKSFFDVI